MRKDRKTLARKSFLLAVAPEPVAHNVFVAARGHSTMRGERNARNHGGLTRLVRPEIHIRGARI